MNRFLLSLLAAGIFAVSGTAASLAAAMDFGSPPSGEIPILYNDHHVYAKPDRLKAGRVLAALVRSGSILVPLRSMFEAMGATVTWDPASKTATAQKAGASVQVTLGKNEAVINGETRPLDVPPEVYKGAVVVPIRLISEALGGYVQWVPDRRIAVVRFVPPTPVPPPPPPPPPATPQPTAAPTPIPSVPHYNAYIQAGYFFGKANNEFADAAKETDAYNAQGAYLTGPFAVKIDYRYDTYDTTVNGTIPQPVSICNPSQPPAPNTPGNPATVFNTIDGGMCFVPPFKATQTWLDARVEYQIANPHIMIGAAYGGASNKYGYPRLNSVGAGVEKLPDFTSPLSWYGSFFYFPAAQGNYTVNDPNSPNFGVTFKQQYNISQYDVGFDLLFGQSQVYFTGGFQGDYWTVSHSAPVNQTHSGPYVGLGVRF